MTQNDVDVDALSKKYSEILRNKLRERDEQPKLIHTIFTETFKEALTEALAGRWAKDEDVKKAYLLGLHQKMSPDIICPTADQVVSQFKSERGIK